MSKRGSRKPKPESLLYPQGHVQPDFEPHSNPELRLKMNSQRSKTSIHVALILSAMANPVLQRAEPNRRVRYAIIAAFTILLLGLWGPMLLGWLIGVFLPATNTKAFYSPYLKKSDSTADRTLLVFVHGIGGHHKTTWEHYDEKLNKRVSLLDMVQEDRDVGACDIVSVGYPTHQTMNRASFTAQVEGLQSFLDVEAPRYRRTVIVAHSMGGLISAYAISLSKLLDEESQQLTLITLSTPFRGSAMAEYVKRFTNAKSKQLVALENESDLIRLVNDFWADYRRRYAGRLLHFAGCETEKTDGITVVAPVSGEGPDHCPADVFEPFAGLDHFGMASPSGSESVLYRSIKAWIRFQDSDVTSSQLGIKTTRLPQEFRTQAGKVYELVAGQTVEIDGHTRIPPGARVILGEGSAVRFKKGATLELRGVLSAQGTISNPVIFEFDGSSNTTDGALIIRGPQTKGSSFRFCEFKGGTGVRVARPNPKVFRGVDWGGFAKAVIPNPDRQLSCGGAVCLISAEQVDFADCQFVGNSAYQGGAVYCVAARRINMNRCQFTHNFSGFGGGALFAQASEVYITGCRFEANRTSTDFVREYGKDKSQTLRGHEFACGGAVYGGHASHLEIKNSTFFKNVAQYVGGAVYLLDLNLTDSNPEVPSMLADSRLIGNRCVSNAGGGGLYVDQHTRLSVSRVEFVGNASGQGSSIGAQDMLDASFFEYGARKESGIEFSGAVSFYDTDQQPMQVGEKIASQPDPTVVDFQVRGDAERLSEHFRRADTAPLSLRMLPIENTLMTAPGTFKHAEAPRAIDTIVIHHTSALNWDDKSFHSQFKEEIERFEKEAGVPSPSERKYDWRYCIKIFELYKVSAHYLIDRNGQIRRLVREDDVAFHAGKSKMPDGRENINEFSIGIELIAAHPDDDKSITLTNAYTSQQYTSLHWLLRDLGQRHHIPVSNILGHDQIAAGRKKDPGPLFDWDSVRRRIVDDHLAIEQFKSIRFMKTK